MPKHFLLATSLLISIPTYSSETTAINKLSDEQIIDSIVTNFCQNDKRILAAALKAEDLDEAVFIKAHRKNNTAIVAPVFAEIRAIAASEPSRR